MEDRINRGFDLVKLVVERLFNLFKLVAERLPVLNKLIVEMAVVALLVFAVFTILHLHP